MRKSKIDLTSIIVFSLLIGFLTPTSADAVEEFSGEWQGTWWSITNNRGGSLFLSITQNGTSVEGTYTLIGGSCSPIGPDPLTGNVTGKDLSYAVSQLIVEAQVVLTIAGKLPVS